MPKLRLLFVLSLVTLAGLFVLVVYLVPSSKPIPESRRIQIIKEENGWIIQCDIINETKTDKKYVIVVTVNDVPRQDRAEVKAGRTYTYTYHLSSQQLDEGMVNVTLYEEGSPEPLENTTYYINNQN